MSVIAVASNSLTQVAAMDQAVKAEAVMAVVADEMGPCAALSRTERLLISRNNSPSNTHAPSTT